MPTCICQSRKTSDWRGVCNLCRHIPELIASLYANRGSRLNSTYIGHVEGVPESERGLRTDLAAEVAGEGGGGTGNVGRGSKGGGAGGEREGEDGLHLLVLFVGIIKQESMTVVLDRPSFLVALAPSCFRWLLSFGRPDLMCYAYC